ncbi:hypothetical protein F5Y06DRAFT_307179 [Hypoxylon sp. FL0890]|nr:hypothetical protein F5Y06DRAFT_307179 [Hypoxylon sp. FL0890]
MKWISRPHSLHSSLFPTSYQFHNSLVVSTITTITMAYRPPFKFDENTRMVMVRVPGGDILFFHENLLRHHSTYMNQNMSLAMELEWDVYPSDSPDRHKCMSVCLDLFRKWLYSVGKESCDQETQLQEKDGWLATEDIPDTIDLINTISLGCKLRIKRFQDDILRVLAGTDFSVEPDLLKSKVLRCSFALYVLVVEKYLHQLEKLHDILPPQRFQTK